MLYHELGSTGEKVSILGFGCMRLPTRGHHDKIDEVKASQLLDHALENGVNYLDTAYPYHGISNSEGGNSEVFIGEYLHQRDMHSQIHLATKLPTWLLQEPVDMDRFLNQQLKRLKTDQIDFYLLHSLKEKNWFRLEDLGILDFLDSAVADGRIKYTGFSSHDGTAFFKEVVDSYQWDMCQLQYNYLDEQIQVGKEGLEYAAEKGIGTVIMEPLKGGALANYVPPEVKKLWEGFNRTPAEWAFRYLWNIPQIHVVLSGMNTMEQLMENLKIAEEGHPDSLSPQENEVMQQVKQAYKDKIAVECSSCGYCMPCPSGINIPQCLSYLNQAAMLNDISNIKSQYYFMLKDTEHASKCLECGLCEEMCSQKLPIREKLKEVKETLGD
ncbi:MAG: aldo/keto reductase [Euryarchaeota archaeon]|jgi:predicted aldo/keto reductase-like oxidoreductase|nr:aldo/keto reductase [Euryarchaeota archaeon]